MMPTFCEIAGLPSPPTDGVSILPEMLGNHENNKSMSFYIGNILI